jgi:hypothetical protein
MVRSIKVCIPPKIARRKFSLDSDLASRSDSSFALNQSLPPKLKTYMLHPKNMHELCMGIIQTHLQWQWWQVQMH